MNVQVVCAVVYFREGGTRCFVGGFVLNVVIGSRTEACFVEWRTASSYCKKGKHSRYLITVDRYFPEPRA